MTVVVTLLELFPETGSLGDVALTVAVLTKLPFVVGLTVIGPGAIGVQTKPAVYLVYWGTEWASGFTTADTDGKLYSSKTLQNYLNSFFQNVGGSTWAGVQTQYCRNVAVGTTSCAGVAGAQFIANPAHQLKGVWTDPTPSPTRS